MANGLIECQHEISELTKQKNTVLEETTKIDADAKDRVLTAEEKEQWAENDLKAAEIQEMIERKQAVALHFMSIDKGVEVVDADEIPGASPGRKVDIARAAHPTPFETFGEQLAAIAHAASHPGAEDPRLFRTAISGGSESVDSDGGFLVQTDFSAEILKKMHDMGQIWSRVRKIPVSGMSNGLKINAIDEKSRVTGSRWGGVQAYWAAEADAATAKKPKFRQMELNLKKLIGVAYATDELLQDAAALGAVYSEAFSEEFTFLTELAVMEGTGAGEMLGIENSNAVIAVAKESGQLANTIVYENILNMTARLWSRSMLNAIWTINQDILPQLGVMNIGVGTAGQPVFLPPGGASVAPYGTLWGRPIVPIEHAETLGSQGDISLFDFTQYLAIEKGGLQTATSMHVRFLNHEQTFRWTLRLDGQPIWNSALTPAKGSNTQSPFIQLAVRA